jgi:membrane protein
MVSPKDRATTFLDRARARSRLLDHAISTQQHYTSIKGSFRAGAVTYYAFLSFFPILAVAFFVVGYVSQVFPNAQDNLVTALETILPGLIGEDPDQISLDAVEQAAATVGLIGLVVLIYSGLGWVSCMRDALNQVFEEPTELQPNFFLGKLRDLLTLAVIGVILIVSVAISGLVAGFSQEFLDLLGLDQGLAPELALLVVVLGAAADTLLFFAIFTLLVRPRLPQRSLWSGALLGAIGAGLLKWLSSFLIGFTKEQPAFQAFGIALILLVWINYFSRVVLYAAAWAHTARARRQ